ncbi:hypothetical protein MPSEU_000662600 [Mayamaea pseudoterrestris]|nr:hypothetical protein MPSEU_000662600 [Mayamaea pseudoterrestris]
MASLSSPPPLTSSSSSARYNQLVHVLKTALSKSISQCDIDSLIKQVYEDDASIFADDQLHVVMDSLLENLNVSVQRQMRHYLQDSNVEDKLLVVDRLLQNLYTQDTIRKQSLQADKDCTQRALDQVKLPNGLKPMDIANYQQYQKLMDEKKKLQEEMDLVQAKVNELEQTKAHQMAQVDLDTNKIRDIGSDMEKVACLGSSASGLIE